MRISEPKFNKSRFKELILYILNKREDLDESAICSLLYFMDFDFYEKHEEHLTGAKYEKLS